MKVVLLGCGAITELYYTPALLEATRHTPLQVVGICDPNAERRAVLAHTFPEAVSAAKLEELLPLRPELAIVASPPRYHASQTEVLLRAGVHVLCEKPMACTVAEAEGMLAAARETKRLLAIGLFRRFFPALQTLKSIVNKQALGAPRSFHLTEGGVFNWPAASASFFQKAHSQGGVVLDLGVHVLDLVCWWFGAPEQLTCEDDALGNMEANALITLRFAEGLHGTVRLSRDTPMSNRYTVEFERGRVSWKVGEGSRLDVQFSGAPYTFRGDLWEAPAAAESQQAADNYHQSFVRQLLNMIEAIRGQAPLQVPGEEGLHSLRLVEQCYRARRLMSMPWLTPREVEQAQTLNVG